MPKDEHSVATDLGRLLRESLVDELELAARNETRAEASRPIQLSTQPMGFVPQPLPPTGRSAYPSVHPGGPSSGIQPAGTHQASSMIPLPTMATPMSMRHSVPVERPKSNAGVIIAVAVALLFAASAAGGGYAWYAKHHASKAPVKTSPK